MLGKGLNSLVDLVYLKLLEVNLVIVFLYLTVALGNKLLPVGHLLSDKIEVGQLGVALVGVFRKLTVNNGYLPFQAGLLLFLSLGILRISPCAQAQEKHRD